MTPYRFRVLSTAALFALLAFAVLAFGAVDTWALTILAVGSFALAAAWAVRLALHPAPVVWNPFLLPLAIPALWTAAQQALGWSVFPYRTSAEALKWLALWLLFAVAVQVFADTSMRRGFGLALVWFGFALSTFALIQNFTSRGMIYWLVPVVAGKIFGPFVNANHFGSLMELIVPSALLLALRPSRQQLIYGAVAAMLVASVVLSGSRAATVLVAIQILVVLGSKTFAPARSSAGPHRRRLWPVAAALAAVAGIALFVVTSRSLLDRFEEEQPYQVRWTLVQSTWRLFLSRPWVGFGGGTFEQVYPSAAPFDLGVVWTHAHNDPVQFAMEWGVAGPAMLASILWLLLRRRWPLDLWLRVVLPVLTVLAHSWVDFPLQIPAVAAAWLLTLALLHPGGRAATRAAEPTLENPL